MFALVILLSGVCCSQAEVNSAGKTLAEADLNHSFSLNDLQDDRPTTFQGATASTSVWLLFLNVMCVFIPSSLFGIGGEDS